MATSNNTWFVRTGGSANNSGGGNTDAADINGEGATNFVVLGGTALTYSPGGLSALTADAIGTGGYTRSVNLSIAGVRTVRRITVLTDTTATLSASVADGSYGGSVGGARATPTQASSTAAGNNAALAIGDLIVYAAVTFTGQYTVTTPGDTDDPCSIFAPGCTIDGTGGAAGTDCITFTAGNTNVTGLRCINAVDDCFARTGGNMGFRNCGAVDAGGDGWQSGTNWGTEAYSGHYFCYARSCVAVGIGAGGASNAPVDYCESRDNTSHGFSRGNTFIRYSLGVDNGGDGCNVAASGRAGVVLKNTFSSNAVDGIDFSATNSLLSGSIVAHNDLTNNGAYGINSSGGAQTEHYITIGNNYFGNVTAARNNFNADYAGYTGPNTDPDYVNEAGGDFTLDTGSDLIGAMVFPPFTSPMLVNIGAAEHEEGGAGGGGIPELVGGGLIV